MWGTTQASLLMKDSDSQGGEWERLGISRGVKRLDLKNDIDSIQLTKFFRETATRVVHTFLKYLNFTLSNTYNYE